ncbi:MAG: DUF2807 domain-containing protein [candidate division Zixibacteria bacterium]|nr:DUF2807 domain-containing protein [candidate division Zixibacteria bacterium]
MHRILKNSVPTAALLVLLATTSASADWFGLNFRSIKGSGDLITEEREVKPFRRIESNGAADIYVTVGKELSVKVTFDDNLIDLIETKTRGKTLKIGNRENYRSRHGCKIEITVPELERVYLRGSGDISVQRLEAEFFEFKLSGSGSLVAEGTTNELEVRLSGSGDIDTRDLIAREAYVSLSGSGEIKIHAEESFDGSLSGSGDIAIYGNPPDFSKSVSGSGSIRKKK